jgi:arylsulfatase A-like enzyme
MQPNVLIVVLDAARRDALEPYGAPAGSTPTLAQLGRRGRALPDVYATACWTVPSHTSLFTGLMPRAAGLSRAGSPGEASAMLAAYTDRTLPEVMRRAGYSTGGVSANVWVSASSGFDSGFDDFEFVDSGRDARFHEQGLRARLAWLVEAARGRVDDGAVAARAMLDRWVADGDRRPFFWFVNLVECHSPYLPPRPYGGVSVLDRVRAAHAAQFHYNLDAIWRACVGGFEVPPEALELARRLYRGAIRYMDDWLAALMERLDEAGVLDDTLVLVLSDHGENFGEGGLLTHALSLDNRLIHVPFVAAGPGSDGAEITSLASVPPLVARAAGLDEHPWHDGPPPGIGAAQFDPPVEAGNPRAAEAVERWGLGEDALRKLTTPLTCVVADGLKIVESEDREEVYDLDADPVELSPLSPAQVPAGREDELARLRAALRHPAITARRAEGAPTPAGREASDDELRAIEKSMKLLGYM